MYYPVVRFTRTSNPTTENKRKKKKNRKLFVLSCIKNFRSDLQMLIFSENQSQWSIKRRCFFHLSKRGWILEVVICVIMFEEM